MTSRGLSRIALILSFACAATHAAPTATPTTRPAAVDQPGLLLEVYALQVRPKRLRDVLPGLPPAVVRVAATPSVEDKTDLGGLDGNLQAEWAGEIDVPAAGEYTFTVESDDGSDLSVNGTSVLADAWAGRRKPSEGTLTLAAGWQPIRVRLYQSDGGFNLTMQWRPPGATSFVAIPPERFRVSGKAIAAALARAVDAPDADPASAHRAVFRTRGFFELPERDGDLLVNVLEGPTTLSAAARKDFATMRAATGFEKLPYWHQAKVLAGFLRGWYAGDTDRGPVRARAAYTIAPPEACEYDGWHGARRHGYRHVATIEGETYTVYTPAADSVERESATAGIAGLPAALRTMLRVVRVEPYGTANEFNGGGGEIWVRRGGPTPLSMIDDVFAHEIGHVLMHRVDNVNEWSAAIDRDTLSTSEYGRSNATEDFAEFTRLYLSTEGRPDHLASLAAMFPNRTPLMRDALSRIHFAWPTTRPTQE